MLFVTFVNDEWKTTHRLNVSPGWRQSQDQMLDSYVFPIIGHLQLKLINHLHISKVMNSATEMNRSPQTLKHIYSVMNKIFADARDDYEYIDRSPVKPKIHRPLVPHEERDFLPPDEARQLLEYVASDDFLGLPIWLGIFCGFRISEIQGLKWGDVDLKNKSILIRRIYLQKEKKFQNYTKNRKQVRVPIPEPLCEYLAKRKGPSDSYVCKSHCKTTFMSRHTYAKALPRVLKSLGLKRLTSHGMRHSCSELWFFHGATIEDVRRLFNHSSVTSTKKYVHRTEMRLMALAEKITNDSLSLKIA